MLGLRVILSRELCLKNKYATIYHTELITQSLRWILLHNNLMLSHNNKVERLEWGVETFNLHQNFSYSLLKFERGRTEILCLLKPEQILWNIFKRFIFT